VLQVGALPEGCLNPLTYIFQDFALLPWRTVAGNVSLVLEDHGIKGKNAEGVIRDVLSRTRLLDFADALPKQLSGGMKQRVYVTHNLAEAVRLGHQVVVLSRRPGRIREIIKIEKPLGSRSFGDPDLDAFQKQLWDLMREEARAADEELINV